MPDSLKRVLLFSLLVVAIAFAADRLLGLAFGYLHRNTLVGETGGKINSYLQLPQPPELTILGNSRTVYTVIPDSLPVSSFNLSQNGMDLAYQAGLTSVLSQEKKLGKVVLLLLDPEDFLYDTHDFHSTSDVQHLKYYYGKNDLVTSYINRISRFEEFKCLFHLYRYNGSVVNRLLFYAKTQRGVRETTGYTELPPTLRDSLVTLLDADKIANKAYGDKLSSNTIGYLKDIVATCKENNTQLICLTVPYFHNTDEQFKPSQAYLDQYLATEKIPYLDYSRIRLPELENPKLWKDAVHPNVLGARIFVHDLVKRMQAQGLLPVAN